VTEVSGKRSRISEPETTGPDAHDAVSGFGDRVRKVREQADLTLDQLSKRSGVSRAMLSKVERGEKSPTIGIAKRIAHALGASFSALVGDESSSRRTFALVTKEQRQVFRDPETGFERYLLSPIMAGMTAEVVLHHLPANTSTGKLPPYPSATGKHVIVSKGHVVVGTTENETVLNEGDSLYFEADVEHWFENRTSKLTEYYLIISAPPVDRLT
jgi:transcriptional regulator with XRE-family HTH domain